MPSGRPHRPLLDAIALDDFGADRYLLDAPGATLLVFTTPGCAACRWARQSLPGMALPVQRIAWVDAGDNGGLVARYEVMRLPAFFLVCDGAFLGAVEPMVREADLIDAVRTALGRPVEELP